jgi:tetratricopeptide (TPR) repeat protein
MTQDINTPDNLLVELSKKERARRRNFLIWAVFTGVVLALITTFIVFAQIRRDRLVEELHRREEILKTLEKKYEAFKIKSEASRNYVLEGVGYAQSGKLSLAIDAYSKAIDIDTSNAEAYGLKGYALLRRGQIKNRRSDVQEAVRSLEHSVRLDSANIWTHYNLALAYWEYDDQNKAIQSVKIVLSINPRFKDVIESDSQFSEFRKASEFRALLNQ